MAENLVDPRVTAALQRNDRYIGEFVEAFNLCPYAKRCRETGKLHRVVLLDAGGPEGTSAMDAAVGALSGAIETIERLGVDSVEVALIVFPALDLALVQGPEGARTFERLVAAVRARTEARHPNADTPFYSVAFHPHLGGDIADVHRAVRFIRRSPDPTVQLVRASLLRAVRGANPGGAQYVNVSAMSTAELMAVTAPLSVSDRIGAANLRSLQAVGAQRLSLLLEDIATRTRR